MSSIAKILEIKGDKPFIYVSTEIVIEGGGTYKEYDYLIIFTNSGHRCGYVATKKKDDIYLLSTDCNYISPLSVHGGITFHDSHSPIKEALGIKNNDTWLGFDAAHYRDSPNVEKAQFYFGEEVPCRFTQVLYANVSTHKDYEYMEKECWRLIDQLCDIE